MDLTVFTPTFNRIKLLTRCYESMKRQTNQNFIWMIIDDGSTDDTYIFVNEWKKENTGFHIEYYYKENGGLHTAYNEAISRINTPLSVCIDSDDYMPDDAVEKILKFWKKNGSDRYAGIVGLDYNLDNSIIGDKLPNIKSINLIDLMLGIYKIKNGDRTIVVRTELYKKYAPMKIFNGEKNFNPHYMHLQISKEYDFLVLNENLRYVEYQQNGMSNSILKQYKNSPMSFAEQRKLYLSFDNTSFMFKFRHTVHLVSSYFFMGKWSKVFNESPYKLITILAFPFGVLLYIYINYKTKE